MKIPVTQSFFFALAMLMPVGRGQAVSKLIDFMAFSITNTSPFLSQFLLRRYPQTPSSNNWKLIGITKPSNTFYQNYLLMETSIYSTTSPIPKTLEYKYSSMSSYDALYEDLYSGFSMFSIDGYNGNSQYIANGYDLNNTARLYFGIGRNQSITFNNPDVSCMPYWYEKYDTDPYVMPRPIYFPFDVISVQNESLLLKYGDTPESYNIEVDCEY